MPDTSRPNDINFRDKIKPASSLATGTTKLVSGIAFAGGACSVAAGLTFLIRGQRSQVEIFKIIGTVSGASLMASGAISTLLGMAGWKTATAAKNARDFVNSAEAAQDFMPPSRAENLSQLHTQVQEKAAVATQQR
ncbi:MAG TPA: hypothetical protein VFT64_01850 [Rickettsiales bacterium]|nr:hypothetical protein [Rickettsiales bacterium]